MKELLKSYAAYNQWANQRLADYTKTIPQEILEQTFPSSFSSIHATVLHMWDAESIWWQRMKLQEVIVRPGEKFTGTTIDVMAAMIQQNGLWKHWLEQASIAAIEHVFSYQNTKKEKFKQPVYEMLMHVFNHGTFHRGQWVNLLRQAGYDKIPGTDYILFTRVKK